MKFHLSTMAPTALAAVFFAALAYPLMTASADTTCGSHMQSTDPTQVCYDHFGGRALGAGRDGKALLEELAATGGRTCYRPADLPKGIIPTWAVMRRNSGAVVGEPFAAAWAEATAGKAWTISVCR